MSKCFSACAKDTVLMVKYHFAPRSFHPPFKLSNASQMNDYCHTSYILALKGKRLESNYQLDNQTMLSMLTTKTNQKFFSSELLLCF